MTTSFTLYRAHAKPVVYVRSASSERCYGLDSASARFAESRDAFDAVMAPGSDVRRQEPGAFALDVARVLARAPGDPLGMRADLDAFIAVEDEAYRTRTPLTPEQRERNAAIAQDALRRIRERGSGLPPEAAQALG